MSSIVDNVKELTQGMPKWLKIGLPALIVAVVVAVVFLFSGGSSKDQNGDEAVSNNAANSAMDVNVPTDDPAASPSSTIEGTTAPGASKPTIAPPKGSIVNKPEASTPTQTIVPKEDTPESKEKPKPTKEKPKAAPKPKPKGGAVPPSKLPDKKFIPVPKKPAPAPKAPKPAGPAAQTNIPEALPAAGAGDKTIVNLNAGGQNIPVDPIRTDARGVLNPPKNVKRVGWWQDSALAGDNLGSVVITGHIDDRSQGAGAAKSWTGLKPGTKVSVKLKNGKTVTYAVTGVKHYNKANQFPADLINKLDGPENLVLITCGGPFVGGATGYADNIVLTAKRA